VALGLDGKKAIVAEVHEAAKSALSAVVADSRGVTVAKLTNLRKEAREAGVWVKVVRNTLARRAVQGTDFECLASSFTGPTLIAFSTAHPGAGARILQDFARDNEKFSLKAAAFDGEVVSVATLATLPTKDEAIARFLRTIKAVGDKKEAQAA
jgi:large subunit ribosomal protein L10